MAEISGAPILAAGKDAHVAICCRLHFVGHLLDFFRHFVKAPAHESLDRVNRILGICNRLAFRYLTDEAAAILGKGNY